MNSKPQSSEPTIIIPPKPIPWYKKILVALHLTPETSLYVGIAAFLIVGSYITYATLTKKDDRIKAGTNTVKISLQPALATMPPNTTFQLWVTADTPVAFMTVKIVFDPTRVKLIGEVGTTPSPLTRIIKQTAMSEANTTGIIHLSFALDPSRRTTPPTGTFQLATIPVAPATNLQNQTTQFHFDAASMQVVNPDETLFAMTILDSALTINPLPTPTPTPIPTATPTPIPTATSTPTPTATPTPPPVQTEEVMTVISAHISRFFWKYTKLVVKATDSLAPNVALRVQGYGRMKYSAKSNTYSGTYYIKTPPPFITVVSTRGAIITVPVTR